MDISDDKWCCVFKSALPIVRSKAIDPRKQMVITDGISAWEEMHSKRTSGVAGIIVSLVSRGWK